MPTTPPNSRRAARGFTLIELLVVVAVLAILISLLLPAVGKARGAAWTIVGANNQRQLHVGMMNYAAENDGWYPGINTSSSKLIATTSATDEDIAWMEAAGNRPVQNFDWISPSVGGDDLPADREARFYTILERFADPSMRERSPVYFGAGVDTGANAMATYINERRLQPARGISYLMPIAFQWFGEKSDRVGGPGATGRILAYGQNQIPGTAQQVMLPRRSLPRQDVLKNPAKKAAIADGFRYFDSTGVDFDASYEPSTYGSFTVGSPIWVGDTSYGTTSPSGGRQLPLSYRHAGRMNVMHWDGHGATITRAESFDPTLWYPSGSTFNGQGGTVPEALRFYELGDTLN